MSNTIETLLEENEKLKHKIEQFTGLLDSIPDPVFMKDDDLRWIYGNPVILNLYGIDPDNYMGKTEDQLLPAEFAESCMESDKQAVKARGVTKSTERARDEFDKIHFYEVFKVPFYQKDEKFRGLIGVGRDITERKEVQEKLEEANVKLEEELTIRRKLEKENALQKKIMQQQSELASKSEKLVQINRELEEENKQRQKLEEQLRVLANTDSLTGLSNRRHTMNLANLEFERSGRTSNSLTLLMIDLDLFKCINDTYGHQAGDQVLISFAKCLKDNLRKIDIVGRIGGEEFMVLFSGDTKEQVEVVIEKLHVATRAIVIPNTDISLSMSVGVYQLENYKIGLEKATASADDALYLAKENGRNRTEWV
ncbi:MAG: diguanylate cyclase (GGDEF)-like protein/PAS domain S-box-containing protein [Sulfurimonas sp.]|jgi:diguanylate cyclase (GGDEF)-like protein/PAS domain S-box-containing protein|uniref:sensor domain-containing diguanylate cyclase n=1 Tax=Sulfurimonas sp. TaxID=2022749 RepID=UPI0039E58BB6